MAEDPWKMVLLVCGIGYTDRIASVGFTSGIQKQMGMQMDRMYAEAYRKDTESHHY